MNRKHFLVCGAFLAGLCGLGFGEAENKYVMRRDGGRPEQLAAIDNVCAWPNLTLMPGGEIVATVFNQPSHLSRPGDVECWASEDGGRTWEKRGTPGPGSNEGVARGNVAVGAAAHGDLVVLVSGWSGPFDDGGRGEILPVWISRSSDGGRTWEIDRESFPKLPTGADGVPFGDLLPGEDGALRAAVYRTPRTYVFRSEDDGRVWGNPVLLDEENSTNEVAIFHRGDGRWLAAARHNGMRLYRSDDDGASWSNEGPLTGAQQHPGHLTRLADGRLLLSYGNRVVPRGVDVRFSEDEGETWSEPYRVADFTGDGGYPSSVQREDGQVVTAYYASQVEGHERYHMGVVIWEPGKINAGMLKR